MKRTKRAWPVVLLLTLSACAPSRVDYSPPAGAYSAAVSNSKIIGKSRDQVWAAAVQALGKAFYVINTVDKSSGLINLSFSGNPQDYVDCGMLIVDERRFYGASQEERYPFRAPDGYTYNILRRMGFEGRVNLIFEELSPSSTRVTANVRYSVTRTTTTSAVYPARPPITSSASIGFNSGGNAAFPAPSPVQCAPTGRAEAGILSLVQ